MSQLAGTTPAARLVRGWLCAALATFLAASSHLIAGGTVPLTAVVLAVVFGALVCVLLAGRRLSLPRVMGGVATSQVLFHTLFEVFTTAPGTALSMAPDLAGHHHDALIPLATMPGGGMAAMAGGESGMLVSHLVAGIVSIGLIRHGENLWWALLHALGMQVAVIIRLARPVTLTLVPRRGLMDHTEHGLYELLHRDTRLRLRGPPPRKFSLA